MTSQIWVPIYIYMGPIYICEGIIRVEINNVHVVHVRQHS